VGGVLSSSFAGVLPAGAVSMARARLEQQDDTGETLERTQTLEQDGTGPVLVPLVLRSGAARGCPTVAVLELDEELQQPIASDVLDLLGEALSDMQ
jgi:hypothetical protein